MKSFRIGKGGEVLVSKKEVCEILGLEHQNINAFLENNEQFKEYDNFYLEYQSVRPSSDGYEQLDEITDTEIEVVCDVLDISVKEVEELILKGDLIGVHSKEYGGLAVKTSSFAKYLYRKNRTEGN